MYIRIILCSLFLMSVSFLASGQYDTIYTNENDPVLLIFDDEVDGRPGNQDYVIETNTSKGNSLTIVAYSKNSKRTFLEIFIPKTDQQLFFILAYKEKLTRVIYNYKSDAIKSSLKVPVLNDNTVKEVKASGSIDKQKNNLETAASEVKTIYDSIYEAVKFNTVLWRNYAVKDGKTSFQLSSAFVFGDYFVFKVLIENKSSIKYNLRNFDLYYSQDMSLTRRSVPDTDRLQILKTFPDSPFEQVGAGEAAEFIIITKATISNKKPQLNLSANEKENGRTLSFNYPTRELLKVKRLK